MPPVTFTVDTSVPPLAGGNAEEPPWRDASGPQNPHSPEPPAAAVTPSKVAESIADSPTPITRSAADNCVVTFDGAGVTTRGSVTQLLAAARVLASPE